MRLTNRIIPYQAAAIRILGKTVRPATAAARAVVIINQENTLRHRRVVENVPSAINAPKSDEQV